MEYFPLDSPKRCLTNEEKDKVMKILSKCPERKEPTPLTEEEVTFMDRLLLWRMGDMGHKILSYRYGLDRGIPRSLEEAAEGLGIHRERIRSIESRFISLTLLTHLIRRRNPMIPPDPKN